MLRAIFDSYNVFTPDQTQLAYNFPTDTWVNFKLFGGMGLMLAFVVLQALFLARYIEEKSP